MNAVALVSVVVSASILSTSAWGADQCATLRAQRERIRDEVTNLEVNYPLFTAALEACAQESKDGAEFTVCALIVCAIGQDTCSEVGQRIFALAMQAARVDQLAKRAGCGASRSGTRTPIEVTNSCGHPVEIAVTYQFPSGEWRSDGWWSFHSGETATLRLASGDLAAINDGRMYYYAETTDHSGLEWRGDLRRNVGDRTLLMKEASGSRVNLVCPSSY